MSKVVSEYGSYVKGSDMKDIFVYCWDEVENPKAIVHIFHGMAEHAGRYEPFAKYLNSQGFVVFADDHRGHGKTACSIDELGYIGKNGFNAIVEDEHIITQLVKSKYPDVPIIILAHSFGSYIAQAFITKHGKEIDGIILSGTSKINMTDVKLGLILAAIQRAFLGEKKKSNLIDKIGFGSYNKRIQKPENKFQWLSRDNNQVQKYIDDPLCGTVFPVGFYYYFFKGASKLYRKEKLFNIPKELPTFIIAGEEDPVGGYGKNSRKLYELYKSLNLVNVDIKLYPNARHEIINETNYSEVYEDINNWLQALTKYK